ncbi:MAG: DUF2723 domain-containing protein [Phycisphaerae bacterium]|nr:DUF2723 domain-containing protein [Phycisphaerae bacterium]
MVFGVSALVYAVTCAPGSLWQDSGMIQYRIWHNDIAGGLGLALAHPLYYLIGIAAKHIPLGEFGFRINLISAVCGAITVANIFLLLRLAAGRVFPAVAGAVTLGLSWTFWRHCAIAETYILYTAIFSAELIFLFLYFKNQKVGSLYAVAFLNGLSISTHMLGTLPLACYFVMAAVLVCRKELRIGQVLLMALIWAVGCLPYEFLIVRELIASGDLVGTVRSALFGNSWDSDVLNVALNGTIVKQNFMFFGLSFPTPNILLFFFGLFASYRILKFKLFANMLIAMTAMFFVFAFRYTVPDRYAFFIPFYCVAAIFIGAGAGLFVERFRNRYLPFVIIIFAFLAVPVYIVVPKVAERMKVSLGTKRQIPYRNEYAFFLRPWQRWNNSPERFVDEAFKTLDENSVIIADGTTVYPLWYGQQVLGLRKDVKIISRHESYKNPMEFITAETLDGVLAERSVYVVTAQKGYCPEFVFDNYDFVKAGPVYKVRRKE